MASRDKQCYNTMDNIYRKVRHTGMLYLILPRRIRHKQQNIKKEYLSAGADGEV